MANTTQSKATKQPKEETNKTSVDVESLLAQIATLQQKIDSMAATEPVAETKTVSDRMVKFISLVPGTALLKGSAKRPYQIDGQYKLRTFTDTEAKIIVSNMGDYLREGYVYIDNAQFVREVGLADAYANMLSAKQLKGLLKQAPEAVVSAFENATDGQRKIILDMIAVEQQKGANIDANILRDIGKIAGKDLINIEIETEE